MSVCGKIPAEIWQKLLLLLFGLLQYLLKQLSMLGGGGTGINT